MSTPEKATKKYIVSHELVQRIENGTETFFSDYIIENEFNFYNDSPYFTFIDCDFENLILFTSGVNGGMVFQNCVFKGGMIFAGGEFKNIFFDNCKFGSLIINGGKFTDSFRLTGGQVEELRTEGSPEFLEKLSLKGRTNAEEPLEPFIRSGMLNLQGLKSVNIEDFAIEHLFLSGMVEEDSSILIQNCSLNSVSIKSLMNKGVFKLKNSFPKRVKWYKRIKWPVSSTHHSSLKMVDSDLGKLVIQNAELKNFEAITIRTCDMELVSTNNVSWPNRLFRNEMSKKQLIIAYRQLKMLARREGDRPNEIKFSARERKVILSSLSKGNVRDGVILILNWVSNNFGQNWFQPVILLFSINYVIFCFSADLNFSEGFSNKNLGNFFIFLNPVHKHEYIELSDTGKIWDFLGRVVSSYFYVQIVAGFRKYSKT